MISRLFLIINLFCLLLSCQEREYLNEFDPKVPKTLSTSVSPSGSGQITISPTSSNYKSGETVTLSPVPSQHWVFEKWDGDASGTAVPYSLNMDSNKSVVAVFVKKNYPLSVTIQGEGTVSEIIISSPTGREYPHGTVVRLTPLPQQGWIFDSWGGDLSGSDSPKNITVDQEKNVTAKFIRPAIASLNCSSATNNGILTDGFSATGVNTVISYTGGNGSTHNGQTVTSTGITGLTATLAPGTFANGNGTLNYVITGTPSGVGTASFVINIGNQTCTISRSVNPIGAISSLNCGSATNNGVLTVGIAANGVSSSIPYSGGNGNAHAGQTVTSTGVTGLTATLEPGSFTNGSGSLVYTITGTPSSLGTASFAISIGRQTCTLSRTVNAVLIINSITDPRDGNIYKTVKIGTQTWFAENLRYAGNIPEVVDGGGWPYADGAGAWAYYENNPNYDSEYGKLYNGIAVQHNILCPPGWHIPTKEEWFALFNFTKDAGKLKSTSGWNQPNTGTNEFGFTALPAGNRDKLGNFQGKGFKAVWWSSYYNIPEGQWSFGVIQDFTNSPYDDPFIGYSCRCIKD